MVVIFHERIDAIDAELADGSLKQYVALMQVAVGHPLAVKEGQASSDSRAHVLQEIHIFECLGPRDGGAEDRHDDAKMSPVGADVPEVLLRHCQVVLVLLLHADLIIVP